MKTGVRQFRSLGLIIAAAMAVVLVWQLDLATRPQPAEVRETKLPAASSPRLDPIPAFRPLSGKSGRLRSPKLIDIDALLGGAIPGQRVLTFGSAAAMRRFLDSLDGSGLRVLGTIRGLNSVRVGFDDLAALDSLPDDVDKPGFIFPVYTPELPDASAQEGAVALGSGLLESLGLSGDVSLLGNGVTIALLDTGVAEHRAIGSEIRQIDLVPLPDDPSELNGHGTALASLVAGTHPLVPGIAPAADIVSIRVADDLGASNSFLLAEGIMTALENGADIINISMGSYGDSGVLYNAVAAATEAGVPIVASAGNEGLDSLTYPAAYPEVLGIGAIDANGAYVEFSNTSEGLSASAPGFGINAAWPGDSLISFSGTSPSAMVMSGAIAATMSPGTGTSYSATQAVEAVTGNLNEAGYPGSDPLYGAGQLDLGRILSRDEAGIIDAAVASNVIDYGDAPGVDPALVVTVENRGTALLVNSSVTVSSGSGSTPLNVTTLPPGEIQSFRLRLPSSALDPDLPFQVRSSISLSGNQVDVAPNDNSRTDIFTTDAEP